MKIESPTATKVGQFYQVPCLVLPCKSQIGAYGPLVTYVPVQLPAHSDHDLGVAGEHFHYDWRFVGKASYDANKIGSNYPLMGRIAHVESGSVKVELRRMLCKREMPLFPRSGNKNFCRLQQTNSGKCIDPAKPICPHRGVNLQTAPIEIIGGKAVLICPGHGLGWDAETGANVARHGAKQEV